MAPLGLDSNFYLKVLPIVAIESYLFWYASSLPARSCQVVLSLLGLWWCWAALIVEISITKSYPGFEYENPADPEMKAYKPFCDFAPWAKCSKVLMSPPGRFIKYFGIAKDRHGFFFDKWEGAGIIEMVRGAIDVPNPTLGVLFFGFHLIFPVLMVLPFPFLNKLIVWAFFGACCGVGAMTIWLAYNLFFVLRDFCVVCVSMYVDNFFCIYMMYKLATQTDLPSISKDHGWQAIFTMENFFGEVPLYIWTPILAMVGIMGSYALAEYFMKARGASAREGASGYQILLN
jgi:vitamin-K-epoxide reductase (warfarin-sensitive)